MCELDAVVPCERSVVKALRLDSSDRVKIANGYIQELDLSGLQLREIPLAVFNLVHLQSLILRNNKIWEIPSTIQQLVSLKELDIRGNFIGAIAGLDKLVMPAKRKTTTRRTPKPIDETEPTKCPLPGFFPIALVVPISFLFFPPLKTLMPSLFRE